MIDALFVKEKAKELAKKSAGAVVMARLMSERSNVKQEIARAIEEAREGRDSALTSLKRQSRKGMQGKAGTALFERAGSIQAAVYHRDGVEGVA